MRGFPQKDDKLCKRNTSAATGSDFVERPGVALQNFDISLTTPEPYYSEEQFWFKIDGTFFCRYCEEEKHMDVFYATTPEQPDYCIGCTYKYTLRSSYYHIENFKQLRDSERCSIACARYIYVDALRNTKPGSDLLEYITWHARFVVSG